MNTILSNERTAPESFTALLEYIIKDGMAAGYLDSCFFTTFQNQLWQLMERLSLKYTSGDSSSLPRQTAEDLLQSAYFTLGAALKKSWRLFSDPSAPQTSVVSLGNEDGLAAACKKLATSPLQELWEEGQRELLALTEKGRRLLAAVKKTPLPVVSIAYTDTVKELEQFFVCYDHRLMACEIPAMIDYQLAAPVSEELAGIQFIHDFLRRLLTENRFCQAFAKTDLEKLLESCYGLEFNETICSFFEPAFINACGLTMLGRTPGPSELLLSLPDVSVLQLRLRQSSENDISILCLQAAVRLCRNLQLLDSFSLTYLKHGANQLATRLVKGLDENSLRGIFTSPTSFKAVTGPALSYQGPEPMSDTALRQLIDELRDCRYLSDKMHIIRRQVTSLEDLVEIMETALLGREIAHFLSTLGEMELAALHQIAASRSGYTPFGLLHEKETAALPQWVSELLSRKAGYSRLIAPDQSPFPDS